MPKFPVSQHIWGCQATVTKNKWFQTNIYTACIVSDNDFNELQVILMMYELKDDLDGEWIIKVPSLYDINMTEGKHNLQSIGKGRV